MGISLSPDEQARAERFLNSAKRLEFLRGRGLLRALLGGYLGCPPSAVRIGTTASGKPFLVSPSEPIEFNLSHTQGLLVLAFASRRAVGVDVEARVELPDSESLARRILSAREQTEYARLPHALQPRAFLRCWVAEEACLKACGHGLGVDPRRVELPVPPPAFCTARASADPEVHGAAWHVFSFAPRAGFIATLAWPYQKSHDSAPRLIGFDSLEPI